MVRSASPPLHTIHSPETLCKSDMWLNSIYVYMKQLSFLFGTEDTFKLFNCTLEGRVEDGYVKQAETSPYNAVISNIC